MGKRSWDGINTDAIVREIANKIEHEWDKFHKTESLVNYVLENNTAEFTSLSFIKYEVYHVVNFKLIIKFSGNDEIELNFEDDKIIYKCNYSIKEDFEKLEIAKSDIISNILKLRTR